MLPEKTNAVEPRSAINKPVYFGDAVMLFWLCKETTHYLEKLERSLQEGRAVEEASNYARWLQFSGLLKIMEAYPQPAPLKVDGAAVRRLMERVIAAAGELHKGANPRLNPSQSTVDEINAKMDYLLSQMAKKTSPPYSDTAEAGQPALLVIHGGASCRQAAPLPCVYQTGRGEQTDRDAIPCSVPLPTLSKTDDDRTEPAPGQEERNWRETPSAKRVLSAA